MGQAKRRGTLEERIAKAEERNGVITGALVEFNKKSERKVPIEKCTIILAIDHLRRKAERKQHDRA